MEISKRTHRLIATLFVIVFSTGAAFFLHLAPVLDGVEWRSFDERMNLFRANKEIDKNVAVVLIDEAALQVMNPAVGRWPWPRSVYADVIEFMKSGGAEAVVFDLLFTENSSGQSGSHTLNKHDLRLVDATQQSHITYHAAQVYKEIPDDNEVVVRNQLLPQDYLEKNSLRNTSRILDNGDNTYLLPYNGLYQASRGIGIVGLEPDRDGVYRRAHLLFSYQGHIFAALSDVALPVTHNSNTITVEGGLLKFGELGVPIDSRQNYLVNMVGRYHAYSMAGLLSSIKALNEGNAEDITIFPDEFKGKIVFIGASAAGLEDVKPTALSAKTPGVFIHASTASNLLENDFLKTTPVWLVFLMVILLTTANSSAILFSRKLTAKVVIPLALTAGYLAICTYTFKFNWVMPVVFPLLALAISLVTSLTYLAFTEGKDKRRVRNMLTQYVSPAILAEVVDKYQEQIVAQVGKREHLTILFSDVRGFTSFSEKLAAEQVVEMLNIHFGVMTDIIFSKNGTLDKFIGDAIMAFWGAPIRDNHHADLAVQSAIEMLRGLDIVNDKLEKNGYPAIKIGIGINTGDVVLGNIGSEKKLDYTVIGDNVNLASRLEGLTSKYNCPILISENTFNELHSDIVCGVVDLVKVKGKSVPIKLYWPLAHPDDTAEFKKHAREQADIMEMAFSLYTQQQWEAAEAMYNTLSHDSFGGVFIERCRDFKITPPGNDWDGVFVLRSK